MEIRDGQMIDYPGNYSYFVEKRAQLLEESASSQPDNNPKKPIRQNSKITDKEKNGKRQNKEIAITSKIKKY